MYFSYFKNFISNEDGVETMEWIAILSVTAVLIGIAVKVGIAIKERMAEAASNI